jgi:hypothetical protein
LGGICSFSWNPVTHTIITQSLQCLEVKLKLFPSLT